MKSYEKPVVMVNEGLAEGVYAASGAMKSVGEDCWDVEVSFTGHSDKCEVEINCWHTNPEPTHASTITVTVEFNKAVWYDNKEYTTLTLTDGPGTFNSKESKIWNIQVYAVDGDNAGVSIVKATHDCNGTN